MFPSEEPFVPLNIAYDEWDEWTDELAQAVRMEMHGMAKTQIDHAVARRIMLHHIDYAICPALTRGMLQIRMAIKMKIRCKVDTLHPDDKVVEKSHTLTKEQIGRVINGLPEKHRFTGADDLLIDYIHNIGPSVQPDGNLMTADEPEEPIYSWATLDEDTTNEELTAHRASVIANTNEAYPGELKRLYDQIRTGTLGK